MLFSTVEWLSVGMGSGVNRVMVAEKTRGDMHPEKTEENPRDEDELRRLLHLLNQPLTAIGNYAEAGRQLIDKGMSDPARLRELFEKIARQSSRATSVAQDIGSAATGEAKSQP